MQNNTLFGYFIRALATFMLCALTVACAEEEVATAPQTSADSAPTAEAPQAESACDDWRQIVQLLTSDPDQEPEDVQRTWEAMLPLLDAVEEEPSAELAGDVDRFTGALRRYAAHLETIDYDLDTLFETRRGKKLAAATSHALTPTIVEHLQEDCEISF